MGYNILCEIEKAKLKIQRKSFLMMLSNFLDGLDSEYAISKNTDNNVKIGKLSNQFQKQRSIKIDKIDVSPNKNIEEVSEYSPTSAASDIDDNDTDDDTDDDDTK